MAVSVSPKTKLAAEESAWTGGALAITGGIVYVLAHVFNVHLHMTHADQVVAVGAIASAWKGVQWFFTTRTAP